jgi:L-threonylcarbamoyladenylate synthase
MVQILRINPANPEPSVIRKARKEILGGQLVVFPTDTVYGLAADPFNERAVMDLINAKKRDSGKGFPILVANLKIAEELVVFSPLAKFIASKFWPGALTLVLPIKKPLSNLVTGYRQTLGIRIPNHPVAQQLAEIPIIGTSANISGEKNPLSAEEAISQLGNAVNLILDGGPTMEALPSTIIDLTGDNPKLVREGAIKWDYLRSYLF